jgi:glycosyltransferase involved in cell wall biosynthesis
MNFLFLDGLQWQYDVATPWQQPLGGSQSALCYLAAALVRREHRVTLANRTAGEREVLGVRCLSLRELGRPGVLEPYDAAIVLNAAPAACWTIRGCFDPATPLVQWSQHAHDLPAIAGMRDPQACAGWDVVVLISQWQQAMYLRHFPIDPARICILRNAIAPAFERMFSTPQELAAAKPPRPALAYTSTPFRGLDVLLDVFPAVARDYPDAELRVYSSMLVYHEDERLDPYGALYHRCRATPGVRYAGSVAQPELARQMRDVSILSYPNTFAETGCIAAMEALAAGTHVVTSDLGALPETTMGFATMVAGGAAADRSAFASAYLGQLRAALAQRRQDPAAFAAARFEQVRQINASCTWDVRAEEWERAVPAWKEQRRARLAAGAR